MFSSRLQIIWASLLLFIGIETQAQDGVLIDYVGTTRDPSAILDVRSTDQGILVPRISISNLAAAAPVSSPATGLLVYNTNGGTGVGYHYWNGGAWVKLMVGNTTPLTGTGVANKVAFWNSATDLGQNTNFHWDNTNTRLGIGTAAPTSRLQIAGGDLFMDGDRALVFGGFNTNVPDATPDAQLVLDGTHNGGYNMGTKLLIRGFDNETDQKAISIVDENSNELFYLKSMPVNDGQSYFKGNVGIGTTGPAAKLDVRPANGAATYQFTSTANDYPRLYMGGSSTTVAFVLNRLTASGTIFFGEDADAGGYNLRGAGGTRIGSLAGTGSRFVVADASGNLTATNATTAGVVTGSGTLDYLSKWTPNGATLGNSQVYDNGTNVGIGTTTVNQKLIIGGNGGIGFVGTAPSLNSTDKKLYSPGDGDLEWMTHNSAAVHGFAVSHQGTKMVYLNTAGHSYFNGGNLGIGVTAPNSPLAVRTSVVTANARTASLGNAIADGLFELAVSKGAVTNTAGSITTQIGQAYNGGVITEGIQFIRGNGPTDGAMTFVTNNTAERMRIVATGQVGIATNNPTYQLDVNGSTRVAGGLYTSGTASTLYGTNASIYANNANTLGGGIMVSDDGGFFDYNDGPVTFNGSTGLRIAGTSGPTSNGSLSVVGLGTGMVKATGGTLGLATQADVIALANGGFILNQTGSAQAGQGFNIAGNGLVSGFIQPSAGNSAANGIKFPADPGGGSGDLAYIRNYVRSGEAMTLEIGIANDADDHIALMASGNVGVGTNAPTSKFEVVGDVRINGNDANIIYQNGYETNNDWRLMYVDDFEGGTDGWIAQTMNATGNNGITRETTSIVGLSYWVRPTNGNDRALKRSYNMTGVSYSEVKVVFTYYFLDSWDNENAWMAAGTSESYGAGSWATPVWNERWEHDWGDPRPSTNVSFWGNSGWSDAARTSTAIFRNSFGNTMWLFVGASLDGATNDETFAIDNIEIWVR